MITAVVLELEVDLLLTNKIELIAVVQLPEPGVVGLQYSDPITQPLHFPGVPEINDQMQTLLLHLRCPAKKSSA